MLYLLYSSVDFGSALSDTLSISRSQFLCHPVNPSSTLNFEIGGLLEDLGVVV